MGSRAERDLKWLKRALTEAPVLARPDFSEELKIQADASNRAVEAVLLQPHEDGEHAIVYISKVLSPAQPTPSLNVPIMIIAVTFNFFRNLFNRFLGCCRETQNTRK